MSYWRINSCVKLRAQVQGHPPPHDGLQLPEEEENWNYKSYSRYSSIKKRATIYDSYESSHTTTTTPSQRRCLHRHVISFTTVINVKSLYYHRASTTKLRSQPVLKYAAAIVRL